MRRGTVIHFNARKGFGFIKPDAGGKEIFFHIDSGYAVRSSSIGPILVDKKVNAPERGDVIAMFEVQNDRIEKGPKAVRWAYALDW